MVMSVSKILICSLLACCLQVSLSAQTASLSATTIEFGNENVGTTSASHSVTLTNKGNAPLDLIGISVTGADPSSFIFSNGCGLTVAAGKSCSIHGYFTPAADGSLTAAVTITDNASNSPESIELSGTGTGAPAVSLSANSLVFASRKLGTTSASQSVVLTNTGDAPLDITSISVTGADASSFVFTNACGSKVAAAKTCSIQGHFTPAAAGALTAAVIITDNAGDSPESIALSGTGTGTADTLRVASSTSPSTFGSAVTFTATISSGPTGTITFLDSGAPIGAGTINGTTAAMTTSILVAGSHSITATWPGNSSYNASASSAIVQVVNKAASAVTWNAPAGIAYGTPLSVIQLDANSTLTGTFAYTPAAGTVLKAGTQTLSVIFTPADSTDYAATTANVPLAVSKVTPVLSWASPAPISYGMALGATQLDASSTVAGTFTYTPAAGTVLTAGTQVDTATFTPADSSDYTGAAATVTMTVNVATPAVTWAAPVAISYGTALSATQLNATSTVAGAFAYTPAAGTVSKAGAQTLSAIFTPTDTVDYATATAAVSLMVNAATPAITWATPGAITYGTALSSTQLDASSTVAGTFSYAPAAGAVLTAGTQALAATFTPTDSTDYTTATSSASITVNLVTATISWAAPAAITYGTALSITQLDATSTVAGTFSYSPATGAILTAGSHTITATFTPTDTTDYIAATGTAALTVNQATPAVIWAPPAAITSGTALSSTQLDATSAIPGVFVYSPAAGAVPAVGSQNLSVTLTPTDSTDYTNATAAVSLTVSAGTSVLSINATSVAFGNVDLNSPANQSVTLSSTGTAAVTVSAAAISGTGFSVSGATFPLALNPNQTATLTVQFDPTSAGAASGTLTIVSNSSTNGTAAIGLSGTGQTSSYEVNLTWDAPTSSTDPVSGYNVYRSPSGGSTYQLVSSVSSTQLAYPDNSVQDGQTYDYIVESVDASGNESAPSNMASVIIP
jgi:hypothetical protein